MKANTLKGRIVSRYGTVRNFAADLNWPESKISRILRQRQDPHLNDIKLICSRLQIDDPNEVVDIFF